MPANFHLLREAVCSSPRNHPERLSQCARLAAQHSAQLTGRLGLALLLALFLLVQAVFSVAGYSGFLKPPLHGDFEAQRHWMELTVNLPTSEWYTRDLDYWGLDYPPLTAFHSWLLGKISERLNRSWVALDSSRGLEQPEHKLFMRLSVMATMILLYAPALVILFARDKGNGPSGPNGKTLWALAPALLYPGLLFVDSVHFQYNHCSLGLFLWALLAFDLGRLSSGAFLFVLALNHKQMELYHALPFAVFLLARSLRRGGDGPGPSPSALSLALTLSTLGRLALVVLGTFALLWSPFLAHGLGSTLQVLRRLFPFSRGLFEDKVANFWCTASIVFKFREHFSTGTLVMASTFLVLLGSLPSLCSLFLRPNRANLRFSLVSCALSFFLFSFQVHEKSILLAAIPALLLLPDDSLRVPTSTFLSISAFSLYPLCLKDGVPEILPAFCAYHILLRVAHAKTMDRQPTKGQWLPGLLDKVCELGQWVLLPVVAILLCLLQLLLRPPAHLPHLFPLLNAAFSFAMFSFFWLWLNVHFITRNWSIWLANRGMKKVA